MADLRTELSCSVCRDIYTDPVTLPCGHNFCQGCIEKTWDWQEGRREAPYCPECKHRYGIKPELEKNLRLRNIVERFFPGNRKCSTHHKCLEYYCYEESVCVCESCCRIGEHRGHRVELLSEASEKKKEKLREVLEKLSPKREETEGQIQRLQERRREVEEKAAGETERVTALFRDIRKQLETLEKRLLSDISRQKEKLSLTFTDQIKELEIKKDELSRKIRHIEELCNMADPLTVLQERESHGDEFCGAEGGHYKKREINQILTQIRAFLKGGNANRYRQVAAGRLHETEDIKVPAVGDLDVDLISETLLTGLAGIGTGVKGRIYGQEATDLLLDINTASNELYVSEDRKSASYSDTDPLYPQTPERFQDYPQVLSTRSFSSGRHYWEVDVSEFRGWKVGVAYPSIERAGSESWIGENKKSWCLCRCHDSYKVGHSKKEANLPYIPSCRRIRISLDYEAGRLSFYLLNDSVRHLHTFTATFTEPLHAALCVWGDNALVRLIS